MRRDGAAGGRRGVASGWHPRVVRWVALLGVVVAGFAVVSVAAGGGFPRFGSGCVRHDVRTSQGTVRAELCRAKPGDSAAVVVLHGCGGFSTFDHRIVTTLPRYGISTLDVDYFGLTPPPGSKGFCNAHGGEFDLGTWVEVADSASKTLGAVPGVKRVGVVGWSLGGGVALAAAAGPRTSRPFAAVAGFSTGSVRSAGLAAQLPPTILLSGGRTDAIPLAETLPLYDALRRAHVPSELYVYPHGSHNWPGRQGSLGIAHAAAFLLRNLRA
jgi:dienelactone hydrolase